LFRVVKEIDAKMLFRINTENPELNVREINKMTVVEEGIEYYL